MQIHKAAELAPQLSAAEFGQLRASIESVGQLVPVRTWRGWLMDGRHRYKACESLGFTCRTEELDAPDEETAVLMAQALNGNRRHETPSQRAAYAAELAELLDDIRARHGGDRKSEEAKSSAPIGALDRCSPGVGSSAPIGALDPQRSTAAAAKVTGASQRTTEKARRVKQADPALHEQVKAGAISVDKAEKRVKAAKEPKAEPDKVLDCEEGVVPAHLIPVFREGVAAFAEILDGARALRGQVAALAELPAGIRLHHHQLKVDIENVINAAKFAKPHAICPKCKGRENGCTMCKASPGWMPKEVFAAARKELRA